MARAHQTWKVLHKAALRADLERLAATPGLQRMIVSHHRMVAGEPAAAAAIREAAATL